MKTNILILILLITLTSCNSSDSGSKGVSYTVAVGALNKTWVNSNNNSNDKNSDGYFESVDVSDPNNIVVTGLVSIKREVSYVGNNETFSKASSDCVFSSSGDTQTGDGHGYFETTLVSGSPEVCNRFVPRMHFWHYGSNQNTDEHLMIGASLFM